MTNKTRLVFVIAATVAAAFTMLMSTQFAAGIADRALAAVANTLGLHEAPSTSALAVLVVPGLYLYLMFQRERHA
jgi:hypothetical protein